MPKKKLESYRLSNEADTDLENIYDYTEKNYSVNQAIDYLQDLEKGCLQHINNPNLGRARPKLEKSIYSMAIQHHITFYKKQKDFILIVRVLHSRMEIHKFL